MQLLQNIKILDFTRLLPGPIATHLLAQMGAKVTKVESPKRMDYTRYMGPQIDGASAAFHQLNHNKESLILDYNSEEGKQQIWDLAKESDVFIEQFRPGAMDAWGLGYEAIKQVNPEIIYVSLTGYPKGSTHEKEAGHDFNYLAYSGLMSLIKDEKGKPIVPDTQIADIGGAYMAIIALQGALIKKLQGGGGSHLNVSLSKSIAPFLAIPYGLYTSKMDYRQFNLINGKTTVNYAAYQCSDGQWVALAAMEIKFWNNFCEVVGKEEWKRKHESELFNTQFDKSEIAAFFLTKTRDEWCALCKGHDVCLAPILEIEELEEAPFHQAQGTFEIFTTDKGTELRTIALPFGV